jgi:hypothetical protein
MRRPTVGEAIVFGLAVLVALSALRFEPPNYALEPNYSDHLQHEYSSWAFLHIGFRIFSTPRDQWHVHSSHVHMLWPQLPTIYPPGLVLFFLPFGILSNEGILPDARVHMLMVMVLAAAGVLASGQLRRTLRQTYDSSLALVLAFLGTVLFVTWSMDGFIDPLASGLGLLGIYWSRQRARPCPRRTLARALAAVPSLVPVAFRARPRLAPPAADSPLAARTQLDPRWYPRRALRAPASSPTTSCSQTG